MKRTLKSISALILVVALLLSMSVTAFAADNKIITFKGAADGFDFGSGSEYTATDLFDNFKNVMPGDTLTQNIEVKNEATDCDYIWLFMEVVNHTEENGNEPEIDVDLEEMNEFLDQLELSIYNESEGYYAWTGVASEAMDTLANIAALNRDESVKLRIELKVPAELGNEFADRIGEVDFKFHADAISLTTLTVHKIWDDNNDPDRPEEITVKLMEDLGNGDGPEVVYDVTLNEDNQWTYTFEGLADSSKWSVEEEVPEGYEASYKTEGNIVFITNHNDYEPPVLPEPIDLSVKKVWADDNNKKGNRPDSVSVTLYNGDEAVEKVTLSEKNNWTYSWEDLDGSGNWSVLETGKVKGYTPSYSAKDGVITITNTATLLQTGQNNLLIWTLGGAGVLVLLCGIFLVLKKRKSENV